MKLTFTVDLRWKRFIRPAGGPVYRLTDGKHVRADDIIIPADMAVGDIAAYLDDLFHEISRPGAGQ